MEDLHNYDSPNRMLNRQSFQALETGKDRSQMGQILLLAFHIVLVVSANSAYRRLHYHGGIYY